MQKFGQTLITDAGKAMLTAVDGAQGRIIYTKAILSSQDVSTLGDDKVRALTALSDDKLDTAINVITVQTDTVTVGASFNNATVTQDILFNSIGWYAKTTVDNVEHLLAITPSLAEQTLIASTNGASSASVDIELAMARGHNTTVTVSPVAVGLIDNTQLQSAVNTAHDDLAAQIATKANSNDMTSALAEKSDKETTYSKSDVDNLLRDKADETSYFNFYRNQSDTNTSVSNALDKKANITDVYDKSDVYTKTQTDSAISTAVAPKVGAINGIEPDSNGNVGVPLYAPNLVLSSHVPMATYTGNNVYPLALNLSDELAGKKVTIQVTLNVKRYNPLGNGTTGSTTGNGKPNNVAINNSDYTGVVETILNDANTDGFNINDLGSMTFSSTFTCRPSRTDGTVPINRIVMGIFNADFDAEMWFKVAQWRDDTTPPDMTWLPAVADTDAKIAQVPRYAENVVLNSYVPMATYKGNNIFPVKFPIGPTLDGKKVTIQLTYHVNRYNGNGNGNGNASGPGNGNGGINNVAMKNVYYTNNWSTLLNDGSSDGFNITQNGTFTLSNTIIYPNARTDGTAPQNNVVLALFNSDFDAEFWLKIAVWKDDTTPPDMTWLPAVADFYSLNAQLQALQAKVDAMSK